MRLRFRAGIWLALLSGGSVAAAQPAIDFSFAGYAGGGVSAPVVPAAISVRPSGGDDGALLQAALDHVAALAPRSDGFRGAVLLRPGRYPVAGRLEMRASGVVLRGSGNSTIVAAGTGRRTLIEIGGRADAVTGPAASVVDETVPAGGRTLTLDRTGELRPGDRVTITRPSTTAWIAALHMTGFPGSYANQRLDWAAGSRDLVWDRTVTAVDAARRQVTVDAPITTAIERRYGGGSVARVESNAPVARVGIENLTLESEFDAARARDEDHSWIAVALDHVEDAWVRGVVARHFAGSAVRVGTRARRVTIEACRSEQPVSEPAGYRRQSFLVEGQQVLVRQCAAEQGMNDFASGLLAGGPNVFLDSTATGATGPSGSFAGWASGVLYERVRIEGAGLRLTNDSSRAQGAGWTAANSVVWNCDAREIEVRGPEGAENLVNRSAEPLYEAQLARRTGARLAPPATVAADPGRVPEFHWKPATPPAPPRMAELGQQPATAAAPPQLPELRHQPATAAAPPQSPELGQQPATPAAPPQSPELRHQPATAAAPSRSPELGQQPGTPAAPAQSPELGQQPAAPAAPAQSPELGQQPATPAAPPQLPELRQQPATAAAPAQSPELRQQPATPAAPPQSPELRQQPATPAAPSQSPEFRQQPATPAAPPQSPELGQQPAAAAAPRQSPELGQQPAAPPAPARSAGPVEIVNGRFVVDGRALWGGVVNEGWWRGQEVPAEALDVGGVSLTRFVPGRTGPGLTEDLDALAARMVAQGTPFYQSIPGLWYDRRRDEHSTLSRPDANVWAPFYEVPWARSGQGTAADGLSRFDLARFNPWYYQRTREFAALCDRLGLVFHHNIYNTHNVLEIPPHWVDYPWRPVNNINDTGLPEPPPIEPGDRIHVANQVYDVSHPVRRALHRALILHELDELSGARNLFFSLGAQFAGPLSFQEFFQDTVAEWRKRTGRAVRIELATSKDITDAILADPARARQVAVIDMRYWQYRPDGSLWAPPGGKNLAFRETIAADFGRSGDTPPDTTPQQVYRQVREYHDRYPDKAIVAWNGGAGPIPVLMAGGAEALMLNPSAGQGQGRTVDRTPLDGFVRQYLASALMNMQPRDGVAADPRQTWCLADNARGMVLLYSLAGGSIRLLETLREAGYAGLWFDPRTGNTLPVDGPVAGRAGAEIPKPSAEPWLLLLR